MAARHKSIETKYMEDRDKVLRGMRRLDRRTFLKVLTASAGAVMAKGLMPPHTFQLVNVAEAALDKNASATGAPGTPPFTFAYISDTHMYTRTLNQRFVKGAVRAVEDVNALDPQPDFVLFGGDLAQLGRPDELQQGKEILSMLKAPVKIMVGEHDWFYDLGDKWQELFGPPTYSFDWKGVHVIVLMSVYEKDFWTARKLTPAERMQIVAGLDNGIQSRFEVGEPQRAWLKKDLAKVPATTPLPLQVLPQLEFLDRRRRTGAGAAEALPPRHRNPWPYASDALQPDREHQFLRDALDSVAVAIRAAGLAAAHRADESARSVRSARRPR